MRYINMYLIFLLNVLKLLYIFFNLFETVYSNIIGIVVSRYTANKVLTATT